jgi:hypothetical protein
MHSSSGHGGVEGTADAGMRQVLRLMSSSESRKAGLSNEPLILLLLAMDFQVLEAQVAVGRHLLKTLQSMQISLDESARAALLREVQEHLLSSNDYWDEIDSWREMLLQKSMSVPRGNKGDVLNSFGKRIEKKGGQCFCPTLLQVVFKKKQGKQTNPCTHVILDRWAPVLIYIHECLFRRLHPGIRDDAPEQVLEVNLLPHSERAFLIAPHSERACLNA